MNKLNQRFSVITLMILLAAMSRLLPHPPNFAPIGGMALFGAAYFTKRYWAFIVPITAMWISSLVLNNTMHAHLYDRFVWFGSDSIFIYGTFALIILFGMFTLKKVRLPNLILSALGASVIFFLVSNFGFWLMWTMYPKTFVGLMACYSAGIPFFHNTVLGDLMYTGVLFGTFEWGVRKFPKLGFYPAKV